MYAIHCMNNISKKGTDHLTSDYELVDELEGANGILVRSAGLHETDFPEQLLAIARAGAGVNNIPLERCAEEGIVVFNTPGANANAVKELVVCSMLLGSRDVIGGAKWCRMHEEDDNIAKEAETAKKQFGGHEISGKNLGVIGLGAIGAEVANAAVDLGMHVYGYDPFTTVDAAWRINAHVHHVNALPQLFETCDYITIHVPANDNTKGMIDADAISHMRDGVVFLNFARDTLVDNDAMAEALESGKVSRYITDFATPEVMKMDRAIVLPHLGASTEEAEDNCAIMAVNQIMDYIENGSIVNSVNYPNVPLYPAKGDGSRISAIHENIPNMLSRITAIISEAGLNIENLSNGAKGNNAYTVMDLSSPASDETVAAVAEIEGMRLVRAL